MFVIIHVELGREKMRNPPLMIRKIEQVDNRTFLILWSDGVSHKFSLDQLQRVCPCAQCYDPITGKRPATSPQLVKDVGATKIESVGRYALRIHFKSGCSKGIYSFALLRDIGNGSVAYE